MFCFYYYGLLFLLVPLMLLSVGITLLFMCFYDSSEVAQAAALGATEHIGTALRSWRRAALELRTGYGFGTMILLLALVMLSWLSVGV